MGNALMASDHNEKKESVINLSDNCVSRITKRERSEEEQIHDVNLAIQEIEEEEWLDKVECMDEDHSKESGISYQNVVGLITKIENELQDIRPPVCNPDELINCMKKNDKCIIKCKKYVDEFISCVDAERINIIKEKYDMEKRVNNMKGSDLAQQFLKDGVNK